MEQNLRNVTVTETPLYAGDSGIATYTFEVERYYFGKDLSTLYAYLKVRFSDGSGDKILLSDKTTDDEHVTFTFTVTDDFTRVAGKTLCQLSFESSDGAEVVNTRVFMVEIYNSVTGEGSANYLPSALNSLYAAFLQKTEELNAKIDELNDYMTIKTVAVSAANFSDKLQTLSVDGITADSIVMVSPVSGADVFTAAGVYVAGTAEGLLTLGCISDPTDNFTLKAIIVNKISAIGSVVE